MPKAISNRVIKLNSKHVKMLHVLIKLRLLSMSSICLGRNLFGWISEANIQSFYQSLSNQLWHFAAPNDHNH